MMVLGPKSHDWYSNWGLVPSHWVLGRFGDIVVLEVTAIAAGLWTSTLDQIVEACPGGSRECRVLDWDRQFSLPKGGASLAKRIESKIYGAGVLTRTL